MQLKIPALHGTLMSPHGWSQQDRIRSPSSARLPCVAELSSTVKSPCAVSPCHRTQQDVAECPSSAQMPCATKLSRTIGSTGGGRGARCAPKVRETSPLSQVTQFSHFLDLCQKPPRKKEGPLQSLLGVASRCEYGSLVAPAVGVWTVNYPGWYCNNRNALPWRVLSESPGLTESLLIFSARCYIGSCSCHCCSKLGIPVRG